MDFNIAWALHLASQGKGKLFDAKKFFEQETFLKAIEAISQSKHIKLTQILGCTEKEEVKQECPPSHKKISYDANMITKVVEENIDLSNLEDYLSPTEITSSAKVLMSGLGADEVFGGYARYATASKRGLPDLQAEISLDLDRLWERNFGRDDRVISYTGRECRYPFLGKFY